jgi:hypothetical protein
MEQWTMNNLLLWHQWTAYCGCVDIGHKYLFANIHSEFSNKIEMALMEYSGARGTPIHKKGENLVSDSL